jgi:four helix bundle protein
VRGKKWRVASGEQGDRSDEQREMTELPKPRHYKELLVWQKGMALAKIVYQLTARFPPEERYGLTSQMRRAAVSVPSNIAEGQARKTTNEFLQFLSVAQGSLAELDTQLALSVELSFLRQAEAETALKEIDELQKMLVGLKRKLSSYSPLATRHSPLPSRAH